VKVAFVTHEGDPSLTAFHDDPGYADILQQRLAGSVSHGWVVDAV
jgi:hypothetical protein